MSRRPEMAFAVLLFQLKAEHNWTIGQGTTYRRGPSRASREVTLADISSFWWSMAWDREEVNCANFVPDGNLLRFLLHVEHALDRNVLG